MTSYAGSLPVGPIDGLLDGGSVELGPEDVDALLLEERDREEVGVGVALLVGALVPPELSASLVHPLPAS